jgi:hypothetical protein
MLGVHSSSPPSIATSLAPYDPIPDGKVYMMQTAESSSMAQKQRELSPVAAGPQVYVVHHDAGHVPTRVYTPSGAVIEDMPPGYPSGVRGAAAAANADPGPSYFLN